MYGGVYRVDLPPVQATPHVPTLPGASIDNPPFRRSVADAPAYWRVADRARQFAAPATAWMPAVSIDNPPPMSRATMHAILQMLKPVTTAAGVVPPIVLVGADGFWIIRARRRR